MFALDQCYTNRPTMLMGSALATRGSHADMWCHLKSMDHALERVLGPDGTTRAAQLDLERLQALSEFLRRNLAGAQDCSPGTIIDLLTEDDRASSYGLATDIRERLSRVPELGGYRAKSKLGFERKVKCLAEAVDRFVQVEPGHLLSGAVVPTEEFRVLRALLDVLIHHAQAALRP